MNGQKNRGTDNKRINLWLIFFLESLKALTEKLEKKYPYYGAQSIVDYPFNTFSN